SDRDAVTVVGAGVTLYEALTAADRLAKDGVAVRVIDLYSLQPIDADTLRQAAKETRAIVTVEDHSPRGGIGEAGAGVVGGTPRREMLAVRDLPRSGKPAELLAAHGIDADAIVRAVMSLARAARE